MFGVIGWNRTKAGPLGLRVLVLSQVGDIVTIQGPPALGPSLWKPVVGDSLTDGTLTDVVVRVISDTSFQTRTATGFVLGFHDVTLKNSNRLRSVVNLIGNVVGSDDANRRETKAVLGAGTIIEDTLAAGIGGYHPAGWEFASIVLLTPGFDGVIMSGADCQTWQLVKLIINVHASNSFIVEDQTGNFPQNDIRLATIPESFVFPNNRLTVGPGNALALIRHPIEDRWRGSVVSRAQAFNVVTDIDNVVSDTDNVVTG